MKIKFTCGKCFWEDVQTIDFVQAQDESLYYYTCSKGHKNIYFYRNEKFELLMESAVYAILDGYYREAVSAMSASLERLHEYAVKILYKKNGQYEELFETAWKKISSQSERQLGAFIFLYTQNHGLIPDLLSDNDRNFRNDVIHKGKFPSYDETLKYGQRIIDITFNILQNLERSSGQIIRNFADDKKEEIMIKSKEFRENPFTISSQNVINIQNFEQIKLVDYLEIIKNKNIR